MSGGRDFKFVYSLIIASPSVRITNHP